MIQFSIFCKIISILYESSHDPKLMFLAIGKLKINVQHTFIFSFHENFKFLLISQIISQSFKKIA